MQYSFQEQILPFKMSECTICFDSFNKSVRKQVTCSYCSTSICRSCAQIYMKDVAAQPRCPNTECAVGWSDDFLSDNLTKTFLLKDFKECREKILLDTEKARLPETQEFAVRYRAAKTRLDEINKAIAEHYEKMKADARIAEAEECLKNAQHDANEAYTKLATAQRDRSGTKAEYDARMKPYNDAYTATRTKHLECDTALRKLKNVYLRAINALRSNEYYTVSHTVSTYGTVRAAPAGVGLTGRATAAPTENNWTFVMKCPVEKCEGFVGKDWKCGLCASIVCKECREHIKSDTPPADNAAEKALRDAHVCDMATRETVKAMVKEAKPCPKCAALISKIDGCDQMWCTQCHTAFSWRTGAIEERVHNPHYYEWMRRNGTAPAPPAAAAQNGGCLQDGEVLQQVIYANRLNADILNACRMVRHIQSEARGYRYGMNDTAQAEKKRILRVKRLVGEIDDDGWKDKLQRMEKERHKNRRICEVLDMFVQAGTDILRGALPADANKADIYNQLNNLREYCEQSLEKIQKRFNNQVPDMSLREMQRAAERFW